MTLKISNKERGAIDLVLIIVGVVVLGGIGFGAWKVISNNKAATTTGSASSTSSNGASANCLATYHDSNLCHFSEFASDFTKTSYTASLTNVENGVSSSMTLESDGKGNTQLSGTSDGQAFNAITLNGTSYIQDGGTGPWIEYTSGTTAPVTSPTSNLNLGFGSGVTFKEIDTEACGSLTCFKYQITDSTTPGATQYVWFDNSAYKLRQWQYSDGGTTTTMTLTYQPVTISKPSPVESLTAAE